MEHILTLSYGKDSLACLEAIYRLGLPLDGIVHSEIWATDTIRGEFPELTEFKEHADRIIKNRYGLEVTKTHAKDKNGAKLTYDHIFYTKKKKNGNIYGFASQTCRWCTSRLKQRVLQGDYIRYMGIASDEIKRVERWSAVENVKLPLVMIDWSESDCYNWCEENDLLSPLYTAGFKRDGCFFCPFINIDKARYLYHNHPDLWQLLEKWEIDSPHALYSGYKNPTDYHRRFEAEDKGLVPQNASFRWKMLEDRS